MTTREKAKSYCLTNKSLKYKLRDAHLKHLETYQRKSKTIERQFLFKMIQSGQQYKQIKSFKFRNKNY